MDWLHWLIASYMSTMLLGLLFGLVGLVIGALVISVMWGVVAVLLVVQAACQERSP